MILMKSVSVTLKRKLILPTFWLELEPNKIYGLIGANGSGKTTLLKLLAGYFQPTLGKVLILDRAPYNNHDLGKQIIFIDDKREYLPFATVESVCHIYSNFYPNWDQSLATKLFQYFQFNVYDRYDLLSKGRKSLFNFIVGISTNCPLTLMDEPTTGMDIKVREEFYKILLNSYIQHPRTIIISNHYMEEMEQLLEEVIIITKEQEVTVSKIEDLQREIFVVTGTKENLEKISFDEVYKVNHYGSQKQLVVRARITPHLLHEMELNEVTVMKLSASQATVYLTHEVQGGIDDVFN